MLTCKHMKHKAASAVSAGFDAVRAFLMVVVGMAGILGVTATEWPQYRGANHDAVSPDRILKQWTGTATNAVWRVTLGAGYSSFAAAQGKAVTLVLSNDNGVDREFCVALNITNGIQQWAASLEDGSYNQGYVGPRSTPSIVGDSVYVLTTHMSLFRLNITNGSVIWSRDLKEGFGARDILGWSGAASPLIENGLIHVNLNKGSGSLAAFYTTNGAMAWQVENRYMTHSTPVAATINGVRQIIYATTTGLVSVNCTNGQKLWVYPYPRSYSTSLGGSPCVYSNMVFISQSYNPFCTAARINFTSGTWSTNRLFYNSSIGMIWMTPVANAGAVFGATGNSTASDTPMVCMDMLTGSVRWSLSGFGRGGVTLVNDTIVALSEDGMMRLIRPVTNAYTEIASFKAIEGPCWNVPAVCDGRVLVRSTGESDTQAACFDLSMPDIQITAPAIISNKLLLTARTTNGAAIHTNRLAQMQVYARTNLSGGSWSALTNRPAWSNGVVRFKNLDPGSGSPRFYRIGETE